MATLATKRGSLVAKEKMLVALATVSVAISSPEGAPVFRLEVFKRERILKVETQKRVRKTASWLLKRGFKIIYLEESDL